MIKLGKYRHFKGHEYEVIGIAKHSETLEDLVVYRDEINLWARPMDVFLAEVEVDGEIVRRFEYIGD